MNLFAVTSCLLFRGNLPCGQAIRQYAMKGNFLDNQTWMLDTVLRYAKRVLIISHSRAFFATHFLKTVSRQSHSTKILHEHLDNTIWIIRADISVYLPTRFESAIYWGDFSYASISAQNIKMQSCACPVGFSVQSLASSDGQDFSPWNWFILQSELFP